MTRRSLFRALLAAPLAAVGFKAASKINFFPEIVKAGPGFENGVWCEGRFIHIIKPPRFKRRRVVTIRSATGQVLGQIEIPAGGMDIHGVTCHHPDMPYTFDVAEFP